MNQRKKLKYYHIDEENRKLYLSDEANKILNNLNQIKKMLTKTKDENAFKNEFNTSYRKI